MATPKKIRVDDSLIETCMNSAQQVHGILRRRGDAGTYFGYVLPGYAPNKWGNCTIIIVPSVHPDQIGLVNGGPF